jgi:DNA-binding transcriptional MerR regulator
MMDESLIENADTRTYFHISDVAKMLNMTVPNLRFWESQFEILRPKKNRRGDRYFTRQDIEHLKVIHHLLKEKGYTIEGARRKINENPNDLVNKVALLAKLNEMRSFLASLKKFLDTRDELNAGAAS